MVLTAEICISGRNGWVIPAAIPEDVLSDAIASSYLFGNATHQRNDSSFNLFRRTMLVGQPYKCQKQALSLRHDLTQQVFMLAKGFTHLTLHPITVNSMMETFLGLLQIKDWDKGGLMPQILRYHVIACHQLLLENLKLTPNATSLQGESLVISVSQVGEATSGRCSFSLGLLSFLFLRAVRVIIMITTNARGNDCSMLATILSV